ncbi:molybdopterin/thiamine biosynthesis adenylyltransferase [Chitinophaga dinghuensis]|uniref:Molybdopterin/thiamine biosynthesis adenylyltransferase n=1 Tax=Chitinophaga dinghuensis TaxID=1539050 RepID=A0A327VLF0_9BACT|nr:HesA/MoeB/ThiF family protein [Chitinophaga dinghuensis]RAJ74015.1 molybdopterin/thiamine biosynthesis adenylyltransferase [Chitinophaga dinghuensis]
MILSEKELQHFKNPIAVPGFGVAMQEKLKLSRVLVIGAGGLGSPVIQYLGASGVGIIGIVDYGVINTEDMHRQPIFHVQDVKKHKAKMAASRLYGVNPFARPFPFLLQAKPETMAYLLEGFDIVIDCTQHHGSHLLINDACILHNKPLVIGEVHNWLAWYGGFNMPMLDGTVSASYRCALDITDDYRNFDAGALGITHGTTGMHIATDVIKYLIDVPIGLTNKLYGIDYLHNSTTVHDLTANKALIETTRTNGLLSAEDYGLEIVPDVED